MGQAKFGSNQYLENVAGHALVGGTFSVIHGGSFQSGALAAGFSASVTPYLPGGFIEGTAASAVVGGTGAVLGGGKFGNGALTGSFGYMFNSLAHAWLGTQATYALGDELNERDLDQWTVDRGTFWDILLDGRADLINQDGETFEIKTNNCLASSYCLARVDGISDMHF